MNRSERWPRDPAPRSGRALRAEHRVMAAARTTNRLAVWTWTAVAAVPAAWTLGVILALASGEGGARGARAVGLGLLGVAVFSAVPASAVVLAVRLRRTHHPSGRAALATSGGLLALTLVASMFIGVLAMMVILIVIAPLVGYLWHSRPRTGAEVK